MIQYQDLQAKLQLLYGSALAPAIDSHSALARELGIRRQNISKWINGADTYGPGSLPRARAISIADLFSIERDWLALPLAEFEHRVARRGESLRRSLRAGSKSIAIAASLQDAPLLFGREDLLAQLTFAWTSIGVQIVWLRGLGGSGKTALLATWLAELATRHFDGADGVFAWGFDEPSLASLPDAEEAFLSALEGYLGIEAQALEVQEPAEVRVERCAERLVQARLLLLLDGLPMQTYDDAKPSLLGPLLAKLNKSNPGLLVVSSQAASPNYFEDEHSSVMQLSLSRLSNAAGVALLTAHGVDSQWGIREEIVDSLAGHPLALVYAAARLTQAQAYLQDSLAPEALLASTVQPTTAALQSARMDSIATAVRDAMSCRVGASLLVVLGLLDRPITRAQLFALRDWAQEEGALAGFAHLGEDEINASLIDIADLGALLETGKNEGERLTLTGPAIGRQAERRREGMNAVHADSEPCLSLHPVVRVRLSEQLKLSKSSLWRRTHSELGAYFAALENGEPSEIGAEYKLSAARHSLLAGDVNEGFRHYYLGYKRGRNDVNGASRWSEHKTLQLFSTELVSESNSSLTPLARAQLQASRATNLIALGRSEQALPAALTSLTWFFQHACYADALQIAGPLLSMLIATGRLEIALNLIKEIEASGAAHQDKVLNAAGQSFRGYIKLLQGNSSAAEDHFLAAETVLQRPSIDQAVLFPTLSAFYCLF